MPGLIVARSAPQLWNVTFNHPPVNLVDPEMILDLQALVDRLEHDPDVTVVVFDSANVAHFLGPHDKSRVADTPTAPGPTEMHPWLDLTMLGEARALIDRATLPADADLTTASKAYCAAAARRAA